MNHLANPPFNDSDTALRGSALQKSEGTPQVGSEARDNNANLAWVQHFIHHLAPQGMPSHELGARVLRGYSELADHIEQFTESRVNQANTLRQEFLRGLGLSAAITKADTAYERIAKREIDLALLHSHFPRAR